MIKAWVRYLLVHVYQQVNTHQFTVHYERFIIVNYINEYQFSHAVKCFPYYNYTSIGILCYLKLVDENRLCAFFGSRTIPGTTAQFSSAEPGPTAK